MSYDPTLPSNRLIYEIRKRRDLYEGLPDRLEAVMTQYGLGEAEKQAWRAVDIKRLGEMGVHPYFLPQVTRLMHGASHNDSRSRAAQAYRRSMIDNA